MMLSLVLFAFGSVAQEPPIATRPLDRVELARRLAQYEAAARRIGGSLKLVMVQPSFAFFHGGGMLYYFQESASRLDDQLCSVNLVTYGLNRPGDLSPFNNAESAGDRMREPPAYTMQWSGTRYAPHDGMIPYETDDLQATQAPCDGWIEYERSFNSDSDATAMLAYTLIRRLRHLTDTQQAVGAIACSGDEQACSQIGQLFSSRRIDAANSCAPKDSPILCIQFSLSAYQSIHSGFQSISVSSPSSFDNGPLEIVIRNIPPPPPF